jgi:uncharacterized protein (TIGR00297 family)
VLAATLPTLSFSHQLPPDSYWLISFRGPALRIVAGFLAAAAIATAAHRAHSLSSSGALAATAVGTASVAAGWDWAALLIAFFLSSTLLSHLGRTTKATRTDAIVAKPGPRDATQVLANGTLFALAALLYSTHASYLSQALGLGALAASTADTWATEIGTLAAHHPRSILTARPVPPGTSGGITLPGTLALLAGATALALLATALGWPQRVAAAAALGGTLGALADSLLGATLQARRHCPTCNAPTERDVHPCGTHTTAAGGLKWLDNDAVNAACTLVGATASALFSALTVGYTQ